MNSENVSGHGAAAGQVDCNVRPHAPVAEVVCYETPRYGKPPMQTYELRQHEPFRALPPGTHQLYTAPALDCRTCGYYFSGKNKCGSTVLCHGGGQYKRSRPVLLFTRLDDAPDIRA